MSVVGSVFEDLRQFNLAEIYDPTPRPIAGIAESGHDRQDAQAQSEKRRANTSSPEPEEPPSEPLKNNDALQRSDEAQQPATVG